MAKATKKLISKGMKKKWYKIFAPDYLNNTFIGECFVDKQEKLINRTVTVNLNKITGNPRNMHINVKLVCNELKGKDGASTNLISYYMMPAAVKRLVRARKDRVDDSFVCSTMDNVLVRIKPLIITHNKVPEKKKTIIRKATRAILAEYFSKIDYKGWVMAVINKKAQSQIYEIVNRIVPVKVVEIREFGITKKKSASVIEKGGNFDLSPYQKKEKKSKKTEEKDSEKEE
jgi:ribosomal protein S3AE